MSSNLILFIPLDLWKEHIFPRLTFNDFKKLRSTCKIILCFISPFWKPWLKCRHVSNFIESTSLIKTSFPSWPTTIYGIYSFLNKNIDIDNSILMNTLQAIDYSKSTWVHDYHIKKLPS